MHEARHLLRRAAGGDRSHLIDPALEFRPSQSVYNDPVEAVDDSALGARRQRKPEPRGYLVAGNTRLRDRREIRECRRALGRGDREGARVAGFYLFDGAVESVKQHLHLSRHQIGESRTRAAIGHMHHLHTRHGIDSSAAMCGVEPMPPEP